MGAVGALAYTQLVAGNSGPGQGPAAEDTSPAVESELDETVQGYADMSPFLREQLEKLEAEGWTIGYGDIDALGTTFYGPKKIIIDNDMKDDPLWATAILAHEVGHAYAGSFDAITDPPTPGEEYGPWLERNMRMRYLAEAESGLVTARVRQEILGNGGPDIGNISDETIALYDQENNGSLSHEEARKQLADELSNDPYDHYRSRLEQDWDEHYAETHGPSEVDTDDAGVSVPGSDQGGPVEGNGPSDPEDDGNGQNVPPVPEQPVPEQPVPEQPVPEQPAPNPPAPNPPAPNPPAPNPPAPNPPAPNPPAPEQPGNAEPGVSGSQEDLAPDTPG